MASGTFQPPLADRNEIHKSCKSLEVVVNVLNDYCEAANAILVLEKKLARALREAAGVKCVPEIPANALNTSAVMFETLFDVDAKFVKLADKECDSISAEIKKWFKKLAKEERAHDDRVASANAKIKQAGQVYEKKSRKNPQDAGEEHTRYMNVLSTVGPEINQDKYNHTLLVTQRHNSIMHSLASCLARVADGQWLRSCEGVRQFSPTVGQLGQWRAYCEGGWSGPMPQDLPDVESHTSQTNPVQLPIPTQRDTTPFGRDGSRDLAAPVDNSASQYSSRRASEQDQGTSSRAVTPSGDHPPRYVPTSTEQVVQGQPLNSSSKELADHKSHSATSLASLASFPSPPTHFPLPFVRGNELSDSERGTKELGQTVRQASSEVPFPRNTESPAPMTPAESRTEYPQSPPISHNDPPVATLSTSSTHSTREASNERTTAQMPSSEESRKPSERSDAQLLSSTTARPVKETQSPTSSDMASSLPESSTNDNSGDGTGFADRKATAFEQGQSGVPGSTSIERSDTRNSTGSVVAALRDKYTRTAGPSSPPRKEAPRLPANVSHLAHRYEAPPTTPTSPRLTPSSPNDSRRRLSADMPDMPRRISQPPVSSASSANYASTGASRQSMDGNIALRRRRIEELEELELREQELEFRMKEREIERKAKELEAERARFLNARSPDSGYGSDTSRGAIMSRLSPRPLPDPAMSSSITRPSQSFSGTNLHPNVSSQPSSSLTSSQPSSPLYRPSDHAPFCGCESCSASQYRVRDQSPSARDTRPAQPPIALRPEKPKGWIRRLSMPVVGNAFSLDSKKNLSSVGIAGGLGSRSSLALVEEDGILRKDLIGGTRNRSTTNLMRR